MDESSPLLEQLPARLRAAREAAGMTQAQVAEALGVTGAAISYLEKGARRVSSVQLARLARLYGHEPQDFLQPEFEPGTALQALFRSQLEEEAQPQLLEAGRRALALAKAEAWLEDRLGIPRHGSPAERSRAAPAPRYVMQAVEEGEDAAAAERQRLGLGRQPLPDLVELLEQEGVRTAVFPLPEGVDGLTLAPPGIGAFVVVNRGQSHVRRRFSFAHEYGHVLLDAPSQGIVSWQGNRRDLKETRANAFAAAFLMPAGAMRDYLASLGRPPRQGHTEVFDGDEATRYRLRPDRATTHVQPTDVVQIAWHFGVSARAAIYRLKNLGLITEAERDSLLEEDEQGNLREVRDLLGLRDPHAGVDRPLAFQHRFVSLVVEALRRDLLSWGRGLELAGLAGMEAAAFEQLCARAGVEPEPADALLPDDLAPNDRDG